MIQMVENPGATPKQKMPKHIHVEEDKCVGCQICMFVCSKRFGDAGLAHTAIQVQAALDFERGFLIHVCQACIEPPCASVCPTKALTPRQGAGVIFKDALCIGCKNCVNACTLSAIQWDKYRNKAIVCIYCGLCAQACPHGVLALKDKVSFSPIPASGNNSKEA